MRRRFEGEEGRRRLLDSLMEQRAVGHDPAIASMIADAAEIREHVVGDILIHQNEGSNDVAFLLVGGVDVLVNDQRIAFRSAGEHVGEMTAIDPKARRSATVRARDVTVAAWVTEPKIVEIAQRHPSLWRGFARLLADRLRERGSLVRAPNTRPRAFIGSSVEGLGVAEAIQKGLTYDHVMARVWTNGVVGPSSTVLDDLLSETARSDFAIFVLRADDMTRTRGLESAAPRDNVVFEVGLFMGALGRERTLLVKPRGADLKLPSDLLGLTTLDYDSSASPDDLEAVLGPVCSDIRKTIKRHGSK